MNRYGRKDRCALSQVQLQGSYRSLDGRAVVGESLRRETKKTPSASILVLVVALVGACLLYVWAIAPDSFGFYHDDGIYVATAKSLAEGHGYHIISVPGEPAQTKYPPFYPFLLSLIWRAYPRFPNNLPTMMSLSILATIVSLALTWLYLTSRRYASQWWALAVIVPAAMNWRMIILATGIYSEMIYAALSIAALHLAEAHEQDKQSWKRPVGLGVMIGLAFLTRTPGIALLIAVAAYYALRGKTRRDFVPIAVGGLFVILWVWWGYAHNTAGDGANSAYYTSYFRDFSEIIGELQKESGASRLSTFLSLLGKNAMLITVSIPIVCVGIRYDSLQGLTGYGLAIGLTLLVVTLFLVVRGFLRVSAGGRRLIPIYVVSYLALHLVWPYGVYDRFLMPLLPFLLLFLITELESLIQLARREFASGERIAARFAAVALASAVTLLAGVAFYNHVTGVYHSLFSSKRNSAARAADDREAIDWINAHTVASDVLVCYRDPRYYLYTGRKATRSTSTTAGSAQGQEKQPEQAKIFRIIDQNDARYLICTASDFALQSQPELQRQNLRTIIEENAQIFTPVFESENGQSVIYRILGHAR